MIRSPTPITHQSSLITGRQAPRLYEEKLAGMHSLAIRTIHCQPYPQKGGHGYALQELPVPSPKLWGTCSHQGTSWEREGSFVLIQAQPVQSVKEDSLEKDVSQHSLPLLTGCPRQRPLLIWSRERASVNRKDGRTYANPNVDVAAMQLFITGEKEM